MPVLLAHAIEDSTNILGISGVGVGGLNTPPLGTPLVHSYAVTPAFQVMN